MAIFQTATSSGAHLDITAKVAIFTDHVEDFDLVEIEVKLSNLNAAGGDIELYLDIAGHPVIPYPTIYERPATTSMRVFTMLLAIDTADEIVVSIKSANASDTDVTYSVSVGNALRSIPALLAGSHGGLSQTEYKVHASHVSCAGVSTIIAGLSKGGQRVTTPTSCTVTIKNSTGVQVCTGIDAAPNADGVFAISIPVDGLSANTAYYAVVSIVSGAYTYADNLFFTTL